MTTGTTSQNGQKTCRVCGIDVSGMRRKKDPDGHYYCESCYDRLSHSAGGNSSSPAQHACSRCGGTFPDDQLYTVDDQFICHPCYEAKAAPPPDAGTASSPSAASPRLPPVPAQLLLRITCPHCWKVFPTENILWVAQHSELLGDAVLGPEASTRFLPTRFNASGEAIDARRLACQTLACPNCHLVIPRALTEATPLFASIIGVPASGKSYFLTAMTWELRRMLPRQFAVTFGDADTISNRSLNEYEETLFLQNDNERLVAIRKTELQGELYDQIHLGQQIVSLPRPFLFVMRPATHHPRASESEKASRVICLYDNAGEHFQPGMDTAASPVTQHLAKSRVLMFLYDPTQDPRFREKCRTFSQDPQLLQSARTQRQETILTEAALRVRRYAGLPSNKKHDRPLIVIVPKADVWGPLLDTNLDHEPIVERAVAGRLCAVDIPRIEAVSAQLRRLLMDLTPEFVSVAEDFCQHVVYIPTSALGRGPEVQAETGMLGIKSKDIKPKWVTAPVLYMFAKWSTGLIGSVGTHPASKPQPAPVHQQQVPVG